MQDEHITPTPKLLRALDSPEKALLAVQNRVNSHRNTGFLRVMSATPAIDASADDFQIKKKPTPQPLMQRTTVNTLRL